MSWNEANAYCSDTYGTSLATIKNNVDAAAVLVMPFTVSTPSPPIKCMFGLDCTIRTRRE